MKRINLLFVIVAIVSLSSCGHKLDTAEVNKNVLNFDKGLFAGISWGDSWEEIKKEKAGYWTIREDYDADLNSHFIQLRKEWNDVYDMMYISFDLDDNKNVKKIEFNLHASSGNKLEANTLYRQICNQMSADYTQLTVGEYPSWEVNLNGVKRNVTAFINDSEDNTSFNFSSEYVE